LETVVARCKITNTPLDEDPHGFQQNWKKVFVFRPSEPDNSILIIWFTL